MTTIENQLRSKLKAAIEQMGTTPNKIKDGKFKPNPFPIGTKAVAVFCSNGYATDSHKWKLLMYFENLTYRNFEKSKE